MTVGEYANASQSNRKALGKVSPPPLERARHEISLVTSYLGESRVIDLYSVIIEKAYLKMVGNRGHLSRWCAQGAYETVADYVQGIPEESIERNSCDAVRVSNAPNRTSGKNRSTGSLRNKQ